MRVSFFLLVRGHTIHHPLLSSQQLGIEKSVVYRDLDYISNIQYWGMLIYFLAKQHLTKQQLYGHLQPIMKTIQVRWTRHARHCWRSKNELISDELLWTPSHGRAKAGRLARTYIQQLCADTGCSLGDLPGAIDDRDGWQERVREIRARGTTWWWWYIHIS